MKKTKTILIFKDLRTRETWVHEQGDRILLYCNFKGIHPYSMSPGQTVITQDVKGNYVSIQCTRIKVLTPSREPSSSKAHEMEHTR